MISISVLPDCASILVKTPEHLELSYTVSVSPTQQMPVILAGSEEQKRKYLGRMTEEPLMCVSNHFCRSREKICGHNFTYFHDAWRREKV